MNKNRKAKQAKSVENRARNKAKKIARKARERKEMRAIAEIQRGERILQDIPVVGKIGGRNVYSLIG